MIIKKIIYKLRKIKQTKKTIKIKKSIFQIKPKKIIKKIKKIKLRLTIFLKKIKNLKI